jgi:hypothetical protein
MPQRLPMPRMTIPSTRMKRTTLRPSTVASSGSLYEAGKTNVVGYPPRCGQGWWPGSSAARPTISCAAPRSCACPTHPCRRTLRGLARAAPRSRRSTSRSSPGPTRDLPVAPRCVRPPPFTRRLAGLAG